MSDPAIEQLEAELRESRFKPWDVETFLAKRHQAKIDALTAPQNKRGRQLQVAREIVTGVLTFIGYITVMVVAGYWLVTGEFPIHPAEKHQAVLYPPPPAPVIPR